MDGSASGVGHLKQEFVVNVPESTIFHLDFS